MRKRKLKRTRSQKQAKDLQQQEEEQQLKSPIMVEEEEPSESVQQDQNSEDQIPEHMEGEQPSQTPKDHNLDDQNPTLVDEKVEKEEEEDQNLELVLVEEEPPPPPPPPPPPQDQRNGSDGTHDLEKQPREAEAPEGIHDLEIQFEEATVLEKVDEEELQQLQRQHEQEQKREEEEQKQILLQEEDNEPEPEGMPLSPTLPPPPAHEITLFDILPNNPPHNAPNVSRKPPKRKKSLNQRQRAALEKKLQTVKEKLQPIPFIPSKTLDFSKHEKLLKRLGLWEFAHLEFDREIRKGLLVQLIVNFNPQQRCSYVNDYRVMVNRADLGRALKLPLKKDKSNQSESADSDLEKLPEDFVAFMEDFVSTWFFLHEDTWILPNEIVAWCRLIRDGHPEKVDWPGLIWFMVEKELTQSPHLGSCYYASHLQFLVKAQHANLLKEETADLLKEEHTIDVDMKEEEDADIKETNLEDFQREEQIELSLGHVKTDCEQVRDEDDVMDFQDCKDDEPGLWHLDGRNSVGENFLQRCNLNEVGGLKSERERKEVEEARYDLSSKPTNLERLSSTELIQAIGSANISFNTPAHLFSHPSGEFLTSRVDDHMNAVGPSSVFENGSKRELDLDDDMNHHSFNGQHKRMRNDGSWDQNELDFDSCMEQVQSWMGKARMVYEAKEQELMNSHLNQQALMAELQQRNKIIEALDRSKSEEEQKRQLEIYRLEHELYAMSNLLNGYKGALKEIRQAFSEYRQRYPHPDEPLYKDVAGPGGVVLSSIELEKQREEREEELRVLRFMIEEQMRDFEQRWLGKFELHLKEEKTSQGGRESSLLSLLENIVVPVYEGDCN
ncbi:uncharacterized protein LOC122079716 [Macadamia integrifolia]|uniref:uncharacterized protein LOC122079716 n=1 Tax=Macadamia integrifolia TaxID=60698 RepID=UPI001C4F8DF1|nr:uncharacterized protein LOC122079716 [Macadamia integrifolia]